MSTRVGLGLGLPVTSTFALPLSAYYVLLQIRVITQRVQSKQSLAQTSSPSAGEDDALLVAARAQANFNENVPLALLLAGFVEANGGSKTVLVWTLSALTIARVLHVEFGLKVSGGKHKHAGAGRGIGFLTTALVILGLAGYGACVKSIAGLESSLQPTACIVRPTCAQDVSTAIALLYQRNAGGKHLSCVFAVRGGGYTPYAGSANIEQGVTIDLRAMNSVTVSPDRKIVSVGGGAKWGEVYKPLDDQNLAVAGGRVSTVGVGGLILGGGISFFSARFGFLPDLFRGLKGGTSNFGVVTSFQLRAFDSGNLWGGSVTYDWSTVDQQFEEFAKVAGSPKYDPYAAVINCYAWSSQGRFAVNTLTYTKTPARDETPTFLAGLANIQPRLDSNLRVAPLSSLTDQIATSTDVAVRANFVTFSYRNNAQFAKRFTSLVEEKVARLNTTVPGYFGTLSFQPVPQIIISRSKKTGGNVLGLGPEDGPLVNALYSAFWNDAADDALIDREYTNLTRAGEALARQMGVEAKSIYLNYADKWQEPIDAYGPAEVAYLRKVSRKYDPSGFFQKALPGGFKLY
ncbi:Putative membrane-associated, eicosanoid/glutathione metabolism (MAPEG) protein [Septoria linicola]|uniref:Membrane-associated, eicosanoid/glutathione metabolism (MAPEG) protein n=1 Tax=Septoria linicola TaxID=215465 RepID=A0A9Q9EKK2_9PEZI|nr:Putative membrane-associated, eicosanoid/glutathione metabolism (MAPEG) protein [Septoria linicola]